jgi:hypothetical protein
MVHLGVGFFIQFAVGLIFEAWWLGACAAAGFFMGREHAQAEYRVIAAYYGGKRANMPWYGGFEPKAWTSKGLLDWLLPAGATLVVAICLT